MKVSDYIVDFLIKKEITDIFGYPGGMLTHFMDSLHKRENEIKTHINYHEQASSFSACGYAQVSRKPGVAFATSGPGATNLVTGIANAYFDNIPTIFITGQVNTNELKNGLSVRQKGFQETDIVSIVKSITKYATIVKNVEDIQFELEKAYHIALEGRPGPVLVDIPMNITRSEINTDKLSHYLNNHQHFENTIDLKLLNELISKSKSPVIIAGNGIKTSNQVELFRNFINKMGIPVVTSMISFDLLEKEHLLNFGFIGAYGHRCANFIIAKSDLVISIGSRLDVRQVGGKSELFAPNAQLIRVDIDASEFTNKIKSNEYQIHSDLAIFINAMLDIDFPSKKTKNWLDTCNKIKDTFKNRDKEIANKIIEELSNHIPSESIVFTDVGQNQVWIAQSFKNKVNQEIFFTGGHAAMGYSLPAAIGAYYASKKIVFSFNGDGGIQMNIQELQFLKREQIPVKIIILNNKSLGMISHFQEMYFDSNYIFTVENEGYSTPNFKKIAEAYDIKYTSLKELDDLKNIKFTSNLPELIEVELGMFTHVYPKLEFGKPNQDQEPLIDRDEYNLIMKL